MIIYTLNRRPGNKSSLSLNGQQYIYIYIDGVKDKERERERERVGERVSEWDSDTDAD